MDYFTTNFGPGSRPDCSCSWEATQKHPSRFRPQSPSFLKSSWMRLSLTLSTTPVSSWRAPRDVPIVVHRCCPPSPPLPHNQRRPLLPDQKGRQVAPATQKCIRAWFGSIRQTTPGPHGILSRGHVHSQVAQRTHHVLFFCAYEPPGTRDRIPSNTQLHADHSAVLWTLLANTSIPCPPGALRPFPSDLIFHWTLPKPPRSQAPLHLHPHP